MQAIAMLNTIPFSLGRLPTAPLLKTSSLGNLVNTISKCIDATLPMVETVSEIPLLNDWDNGSYLRKFNHDNGTINTICQLTGIDLEQLILSPEHAKNAFSQTPYIQTLIPRMVDYFETGSYIFTHGWIPCWCIKNDNSTTYIPFAEWRTAPKLMWTGARWRNGMEAAHNGIIEPSKTIVCGHWNCSFGHSHYENDGGEFDNNPNFNPYYAEGIIALDACTSLSGKVNCVVVEE